MTEIDGREFVVIGENVHATRVLLAKGSSVGVDPAGRQAIVFADADGRTRHLPIPEPEKELQAYLEGRIKHVRIAVQVAMAEGADAEVALVYLRTIVQRQIDAGAHFLDVNVDEISPRPAEAIAAMRWLAATVAGWTALPLGIDSSNLDIIRAGFDAVAGLGPAPLLNSASLERIEALDLAAAAGGPVIVTSAGETGMPRNAQERADNASRMVESALAKGIAIGDVYIDPLVFPISVDPTYGNDCLDAFRMLRTRFGPEIRLTGGLSNVSFGLPHRKLLNDAFIVLAVEAGADSGIVDPVSSSPASVFARDRESLPFRLAVDVLTGVDAGCKAYLKAFRAGELG
ncbi:MAG: dihydropteroate synthase [Gaiellales bacterium]